MTAEDVVVYSQSLAQLREYQSGLDYRYELGLEAGLEKGRSEGLEAGLEKGRIEMARKMKKAGIDVALIASMAELPIARIEEL